MSGARSHRLHAFAKDTRGAIAVIFALVAFVLIATLGLGMDYWFALNDKERADSAADSAGLAAVNTAKAFFAANSGALSQTDLVNGAISAGQKQGAKVFNVNLGASDAAPTMTSSVKVTYANLQFTASVTYSGATQAFFGNLVGYQSYPISGASVSVSGLPRYIDFHLVTDLSASMGIPTNDADQKTLIANNPDNALYASNYPSGCQFACHYSGYQGFAYTQSHGIRLKLNDVGDAISGLLTSATNTKVIADQFRVAIYGFIVNSTKLASLSADFTSASAIASNLANYIDDGASNNNMNAGGTHFNSIWSTLQPALPNPGTGSSDVNPLEFVVLITDGVNNSQTYSPFTGSWPALPDTTSATSFCTLAKKAGYTVAVLLIPYDPIVDPVHIWNDEDYAVNYLVDPTKYPAPNSPYVPSVPTGDNLSINMQSCASPGYFFSAATSDQISAAMQQIFFQAVESTRMTQ